MLRILDRYLLRELVISVLAATIVLLLIFTGGTFARVLQQVANGSFPASIMFQVLGLRTVSALPGLLPLSLFLGVILALGRLWRDSEMHVLTAAGMGLSGLLRPAMLLGIPVAALIGLLALWLGPLSSRSADRLIAEANRSVIAAGLDAGRFTALPGGDGVIFVTGMNRAGTRLDQVFLSGDQAASGQRPARIKLITARRGQLYQGGEQGGRYLGLIDGWQYQIPLGHEDWQRMHFQRNDVALSEVRPGGGVESNPLGSTATSTLLATRGPAARAELAWRMAAPVTALVLLLMALPLSHQSPREARYGRLLIAIMAYLLYFLLLSLGRALIERGTVHDSAPMWVLHLLVGLAAWWMLRRQYRSWRPATAS